MSPGGFLAAPRVPPRLPPETGERDTSSLVEPHSLGFQQSALNMDEFGVCPWADLSFRADDAVPRHGVVAERSERIANLTSATGKAS